VAGRACSGFPQTATKLSRRRNARGCSHSAEPDSAPSGYTYDVMHVSFEFLYVDRSVRLFHSLLLSPPLFVAGTYTIILPNSLTRQQHCHSYSDPLDFRRTDHQHCSVFLVKCLSFPKDVCCVVRTCSVGMSEPHSSCTVSLIYRSAHHV